jgi:hypothetical protein
MKIAGISLGLALSVCAGAQEPHFGQRDYFVLLAGPTEPSAVLDWGLPAADCLKRAQASELCRLQLAVGAEGTRCTIPRGAHLLVCWRKEPPE